MIIPVYMKSKILFLITFLICLPCYGGNGSFSDENFVPLTPFNIFLSIGVPLILYLYYLGDKNK